MVLGDDGGCSVLAGCFEAFAVEGVAGGGVDAGEEAAAAEEVEEVIMKDGRGDFRDTAGEGPG